MFEKNNETRYFNFPIQLLTGFLENSRECLDNIFDYAIYNHLQRYYEEEFLEIDKVANFFGVRIGNEKKTFENGMNLFDSIPDRSPMVGIQKDIFFKYYKEEKNEFDKVTLIAYLALKSIVGKKSYCKTDNKFWFGRMDGKVKSVKDFSELSPLIKRYATEHYCQRLKDILQNDWYLITYSKQNRGFYVSFSMTLEDLAYQAEKRRQSNKIMIAKQQKEEAYKKAMKRLKDGL